jgi:aryl-phospho-beta-D-glucosidase BglC (GH1 family)
MRKRSGVIAIVAIVVIAAAVLIAATHHSSTSSTPATPQPTATTSPTTTSPTTAPSGFLHTDGTLILNSADQVVQLTGLNVQGMENTNVDGSNVPGTCNDAWRPLTETEVQEIASYGFKAVRLPIAWGNIEPTAPTVEADGQLAHHWNTPYIDALKSEIGLLGAAHLQVILDMHQSTWGPAFTTPATSKKPSCPGEGMPTWLNPNSANETPQTASCDFYAGQTEPGVPGTAWADFTAAETYIDGLFASDPTIVGQDVVNEPYCGRGTANLNGFYAEVAPAIRKVSPNILIILEDKDDPGAFELTKLPPVDDLLLSIHLHEDYWTVPSSGQTATSFSGLSALEANVTRSQQWNVPLYVGEFYAFDGSGAQDGSKQKDDNFVSDTKSFLTYCQQHDISWTFWAWTQKVNPTVQPEFNPQIHSALTSG